MFNWREHQSYKSTGTTSPIYLPRGGEPKAIKPGEGYFFVHIKGAQAAFAGPIWERVKRLIVTSQVSLNHSALGTESLRAIQRSIAVKKNRAEQLGMSPNLIKLVPATMAHVSISIEFILDKENRLAALGGLINDDAFLTAVSLAPGAAMVARTVGGLSQKLLQTFIRAEEREPILQFSGDFNITDGLRDGYYVILGTRDENNPLPRPLPELGVKDGLLVADGEEVSQLSYVILDVRCVDARTRDLNDGAAWDSKLQQAEALTMSIANNPLASEDDRRQAWLACLSLLKDAQILLSSDANYLKREAHDIIKAAFASCSTQILGGGGPLATRGSEGAAHVKPEALLPGRNLLGIPPDENLGQTLDRYAEEVAEARRVLRAAGA
jgi:hypothetical protein